MTIIEASVEELTLAFMQFLNVAHMWGKCNLMGCNSAHQKYSNKHKMMISHYRGYNRPEQYSVSREIKRRTSQTIKKCVGVLGMGETRTDCFSKSKENMKCLIRQVNMVGSDRMWQFCSGKCALWVHWSLQTKA